MGRIEDQIRSVWKKTSKKIAGWAEKEFSSPFYLNGKILYHYTNSAGLKGIIETHSLWATNLSFVNDSKELKLGLAVYQEICKKLQLKVRDKVFKKIVKEFLNRLNGKTISNRYACCFTENGDQLSQWIGYGSNGLGYAIGFETKKLVGHLKPSAEPSRIIYDVETQKKYVERHLEELVGAFSNLFKDEKAVSDLRLQEILNILEQEAEITILGFKHTGFKEESENRLHLAHKTLNKVSILDKNGMLIPYIELKSKKISRLPIVEITIGPTADYERAKKGVDFLLKKNGYKEVEVRKSEIPYQP